MDVWKDVVKHHHEIQVDQILGRCLEPMILKDYSLHIHYYLNNFLSRVTYLKY